MTVQEAIIRLEPALTRYGESRYRFCCPNGILIVKFVGTRAPKRFKAHDKLCFRIDLGGMTVEELATGAPRERLLWEQIESLTAGEPETSSGLLFQG